MIFHFSTFLPNTVLKGCVVGCYLPLFLISTLYVAAQNLTSARDNSTQTDKQNPVKANNGKVIENTTQRGPVQAKIKLEPSEPIIGDILTLTLQVSAEAEVELLMPEFGQSLERFTILDFVPREKIDDQGRTVVMHRYRLQPSSSGTQAIPPLMIEFVDRRPGNRLAPEGEDAYEILTERLEFNVKSVVPTGASNELKAPLRELAPLGAGRGKIWMALIAVSIILLLGLPFAWRSWQHHRIGSRRRSAYDIANSRLSKLRASPKPEGEEISAFFVELSDIVRHYLEDRFNLHAPELTTEEFLEVAATSPDLTAEHKNFLQDFLRQADQVKFAQHIPDSQSIDNALRSATNFLEQTKQDAPLLDEPTNSQASESQGEIESRSVSNASAGEAEITALGQKR